MMSDLSKGRMIITNWHVLEPQSVRDDPPGGGSRVERRGVPATARESVLITSARTSARGGRAYTPEAYSVAKASGEIRVLDEERDALGNLTRAAIEATRYVESDSALVARVLGRAGGKQNILVINDEAHHAYRIPPDEPDADEQEALFDDDDEDDDLPDRKEATVWVDGLDRIQKIRGINMCVDLSATPYFLGRMGGSTNTVFPWVVSDFGLTDAIESGLVKVPQLVAADDTGRPQPAYFNIWEWIKPRLTRAERGTARGGPRPEAILKHAHTPIAMLGGMWWKELRKWEVEDRDARPPVFILVARNKRLARALFEWIGENRNPPGVAPLNIPPLANVDGRIVTIRVDTGVVAETDSDNSDSYENRWMRLTLDTVGSLAWPEDRQGRPVYPVGFEDLAKKLSRPVHPPGRDVRCIVSVGMLTEGWDCNTVTHVIGLRPFQSQLLCEQVVGRALRRRFYDIGEDGHFEEEIAKVFGVPFEVVPFKATNADPKPKPPQRRIYPVPSKARHAITVPNVQGFQMGVRNRIAVEDWASVAGTTLDPQDLPSTSAMAAALNMNRPSVTAPGGAHMATLDAFRAEHREQQLAFQMAADLTRLYAAQPTCEAPAHVLFPQILRIVQHYLDHKVVARPPALRLDAFLSP
jgi:type III restriction enzyme